MTKLAEKKCEPCEGGVSPLTQEEAEKMLKEIPRWALIDDGKKIKRTFRFSDFKEAIDFVKEVARLAEAEGHHPDIYIFYNQVRLELWTHAINGLSENDFILAAKIDTLPPLPAKGQGSA
jgi:4a-hydroxytetrahydrobiopterin dehydratase